MIDGREGRAWTKVGAAALIAVWAAGLAASLALSPADPSVRRGVAVVAAVCLAGSLGGWLLARLGDRLAASAAAERRQIAVAVGLGGVALRLAPPLVMLTWLRSGGAALAAGGVDRVLLGIYGSLLATDIVLTIMGRPGSVSGRGRNEEN